MLFFLTSPRRLNHKHLINILSKVGIRGITLSLFIDYLTNRKQRVKVDGVQSDSLIIKTGVPQGTIMGLILFLLYTNHLLNNKIIKGNMIAYADDTVILFEADSWNEVYCLAIDGMEKVSEWYRRNFLHINFEKLSS